MGLMVGGSIRESAARARWTCTRGRGGCWCEWRLEVATRAGGVVARSVPLANSGRDDGGSGWTVAGNKLMGRVASEPKPDVYSSSRYSMRIWVMEPDAVR